MILRASDLKGFPGARHCGESVIEHIDPGPTMEEEYYFDVIIKAHNDDRLQRAAADLLGDLYDWSKQGKNPRRVVLAPALEELAAADYIDLEERAEGGEKVCTVRLKKVYL